MFLWRQEDTSSLHLFIVDFLVADDLRNFSLRQRLLLLELLYGGDENAPGSEVFKVVVFEGPDMLDEFGGVSVFSVAE